MLMVVKTFETITNMKQIALIACVLISTKLLFALPLERDRLNMNAISRLQDDLALDPEIGGENYNYQTSTNFKEDNLINNSMAPQISLEAVSNLESDAMGIIDKDSFNREDFFYPKVPLVEEMISGTNFSLVMYNCTPNSTNPCNDSLHAPQFENSTLTKGLILCTIAVFSFVGNVATLASIIRAGRQGSSTVYMLLSQLAIADLLVTLFCILAEGLWTLSVAWYGGNVLCKVVKFMQMLALYLSTFVLVLIGFDRLCAVRFPMRRVHAKHHVRRGIVCIWLMSGIFSLPQVEMFLFQREDNRPMDHNIIFMMLFIFSVMRGPFVEEFYQCVTYAFYTAQWQEQLYTTLTLVFMFLLPLLILITTYIATFLTIANRKNTFSERISRSAFVDARHKILHKAKVKSLMITVVIVLTFVICWTPYYIMMIIFMFLEPDEQLSQDLQSAIFFFGSSTAMFNPLIYGAFHLRSKNKSRSKSTSFYNNSTSSRMENSFLTTFRRSHPRKSQDENIGLQSNGNLSLPSTSRYRERNSIVTELNSSIRAVPKTPVSSF